MKQGTTPLVVALLGGLGDLVVWGAREELELKETVHISNQATVSGTSYFTLQT